MFRLAAAMILCPVAFAQTAQEAEIALAVKSPTTLARYVESHSAIDWKALRSALGLKEEVPWLAPCGGDFGECSAEIVALASPDQAIVIIRGGGLSFAAEYLRYLLGANGDWQFAGENSASKRNGPSNHEVMRVGGKPFLKISSDHSEGGAAISQEIEDWFDLAQPDFEPVFSFTVDGSQGRWGFGVSRTVHAQASLSQTPGVERIDMILSVQFDGMRGLNANAWYSGVWERSANERKFALLRACTEMFCKEAMSTKDFEDLADPVNGPSNEKLLEYALPGLQEIAMGSDPEAKQWLQSILDHAKDTPEKRTLLDLLTKPSAPAQPRPPTPR